MKIGIDYWQVISHYPDEFRALAARHLARGDEVHVISAVGTRTRGTVAADVTRLEIPVTAVHEVYFGNNPALSPQLKTALCLELGIEVFHDDRQDVCDALRTAGIIAILVPRKQTPHNRDKRIERL